MVYANSYTAQDDLQVGGERYTIWNLAKAEAGGLRGVGRLPYSLQVLLENALRHEDGGSAGQEAIEAFSRWSDARSNPAETCLLYTSPSPRDQRGSRMPSSA